MNVYLVKGELVLLDSDLASLFEKETRLINQASKRNKDRFFPYERFQLTEDEWSATNRKRSHGGGRTPPFVYNLKGSMKIKFCLNPQSNNGPTYPLKDILINEKVLEEYIKTFPLDFLGENGLLINSQQEVLGGLRPDLSFHSGKGLLVSEIQLGNLDRYHLYKSLEYRDLFKIKYKTDKVRVVVFCNGLHDDYLQILRIHKVEIVHKDSDWIYDKWSLNADQEVRLNKND